MNIRKTLSLLLLVMLGLAANAQIIDGRNFSIDGFAAYPGVSGTNHYHANGTTGGEGGKVVVADNFSQLQAYLQAKDPYVILVKHDITTGIKCYVDDLSTGHLLDDQSGATGVETTYGERILVASNKTLIGINDESGNAPLFSRITFVLQCQSNVIIRNCRFTMVGVPILKSGENKVVAWRDGQQKEVGDPDCIGIQADANSASKDFGSHIWVDHCEFFNGNAANKDRYDGLLDCKNNVQWLTFSYNYFHDHDKSCLWGKGNSDIYEGCRTISCHHNYFKNIDGSRLPLQRGGHVHYANNYMNNCSDGWDLRAQAVGYVEACYFKDTKAPIMPSGEGEGLNINKAEGYDIIYDGCRRIIDGYTDKKTTKFDELYTIPASDWVPTQTAASYIFKTLDKTEDVPAICEKYSGAGKIQVWQEAVPEVDEDEFKKAAANYLTGPTYDEEGNKVGGSGSGGGSSQPSDYAAMQWDFTQWSSETLANLAADATNWGPGSGDMAATRYTNKVTVSGTVQANGVDIAETKGLQFGSFGADKLRLDYGTGESGSRISLNGSKLQITIPNLAEGDIIQIDANTAKSGESRGFTFTNADITEKKISERTVMEVKAAKAGSVVLATTSGMQIFSIKVVQNPTAIATPNACGNKQPTNHVYNIYGQSVSADYRGIVIKNGKKFLKK